MMRILDTMRTQYCVYWAPTGLDGYGNRLFSPPVELRVRWESVVEILTMKEGRQVEAKSKIYSGEDLLEDGVLWLGSGIKGVLLGLTTDQKAKPFSNVGAVVILRFAKIPTLSGTQFLRTAWA